MRKTTHLSVAFLMVLSINARNNSTERKHFINNINNIHVVDINCMNIIAGDFNLLQYSIDAGYIEITEEIIIWNAQGVPQ